MTRIWSHATRILRLMTWILRAMTRILRHTTVVKTYFELLYYFSRKIETHFHIEVPIQHVRDFPQRKKFSGETGFSGDGKNEILHACASPRDKIIRQEATTWPSHVFWWRIEVSNSFSHVDRPIQHIYANNDRHSALRAAVKYVRLIVACLLALRIATEYNSFGRALKYAMFGEILEDPLLLRLILETYFLWGTKVALTASLDRGRAKKSVYLKSGLGSVPRGQYSRNDL